MILAGKYGQPPADGFGAEYKGAFYAAQMVRVTPNGNCQKGNKCPKRS
jgi:hypothetical protein